MKAAAYLRVSTDEQAREGVSLEMQEQRCREAALAAGASSVTVYRDEGFTATNLNRPALQEMLAALPDLDAIYVWKLSRVSRRLRELLQVCELCDQHGVHLVSVTEPLDLTSPLGRALRNILGTFDELQVEIIRENVRAALDSIARSGRWPGSGVFGYDAPGDGQTIVPNPAEAEVVQAVFRRYNRGDSLMEIVRWLNGRHVPQKFGGQSWSTRHLHNMLANPVYLGKMRWHGEVLAGTHEPIISPAVFRRAQTRLRLAPLLNRGRPIRTLAPLLRCGFCGGRVHVKSAVQGKIRYYYVRCADNSLTPIADRHPALCVPYEKTVAAIWRHTELLFEEGDLEEAVRQYQARRQPEQSRQTSAQRERLREIDDALEMNLDLLQRGLMPLELLEENNALLMAEREGLQRDLERAADREEQTGEWQKFAGLEIAEALARLQRAEASRQVGFLAKLYDRVDVHKGRLVFRYRYDLLPPAERPLPAFWAPRRGLTDLDF